MALEEGGLETALGEGLSRRPGVTPGWWSGGPGGEGLRGWPWRKEGREGGKLRNRFEECFGGAALGDIR